MFLSGVNLKNSIEKYNRLKRREKYSGVKGVNDVSNVSFILSWLILSIIFFVMEIIILYYSIAIALSCTQKGPERIVNLVLAVSFPVPYMMLNLLFNNCAKSRLQK